MNPFILIDQMLQPRGFIIEQGSLYKFPKWTKWRKEDCLVSLHGSPSTTLTTLTVIVGNEQEWDTEIWNLTGIPEHSNLESLVAWSAQNQPALDEFEGYLNYLVTTFDPIKGA